MSNPFDDNSMAKSLATKDATFKMLDSLKEIEGAFNDNRRMSKDKYSKHLKNLNAYIASIRSVMNKMAVLAADSDTFFGRLFGKNTQHNENYKKMVKRLRQLNSPYTKLHVVESPGTFQSSESISDIKGHLLKFRLVHMDILNDLSKIKGEV